MLAENEKFRQDNTEDHSDADLDLLNEALEIGLDRMGSKADDDSRHSDVANISSRISNNWSSRGNTIESLLK